MPDNPGQAELGESNDNKSSGSIQSIVGFSVLTGVVSIIASYVVLGLDLASGEYGGVKPIVFVCLGLPSGFLGMLGGYVWRRIRRVSKLEVIDVILLNIIGLIAGIIPFVCIELLPQ